MAWPATIRIRFNKNGGHGRIAVDLAVKHGVDKTASACRPDIGAAAVLRNPGFAMSGRLALKAPGHQGGDRRDAMSDQEQTALGRR
jgi:hypothetical protein